MKKFLILLLAISLMFLANSLFGQSVKMSKSAFDSLATSKGYIGGNLRWNKTYYSITFLRDSVLLIPYTKIFERKEK